MQLHVQFLLSICFHLIAIIDANRWPSPDDFALRIQTKLVTGPKKIHVRPDDFHVDFFAMADGSEKGDSGGMVVTKYQLPDGKHVTEVFDWKNTIRFIRLILPGEIAQGQSPFQQFCFASTLGDTDLLSADSVLRLRQKNSMAVRLSEEDRGIDTSVFSYFVPSRRIPKSWAAVASKLCGSVNGFFVTDSVYSDIAKNDDGTLQIRQVNPSAQPSCIGSDPAPSCSCVIKYCLPWYPCGWKYCDENHAPLMHNTTSENAFRCGVRSCRIRRVLNFQATGGISAFCDPSVDIDVC